MSEERTTDYMVVARRYRPQKFQDVVGQEHVETALSNAIQSGRVGHAYLFTGARGVGKTSTARIFAKALNCVNGPTTHPCGECESCVGITAGEDVDVLEIDGASNRGIEEIRALRQGANVRPTRSRYKIYIIDEVHMLTREAFNALLKTLEEPPGHVKFIFCTTEPTKIPITILSRCQRFDFAGISTLNIADRLASIIQTEGVTAEPEAIDLLARRANGSMRDGQSLLEQLLSFAPDHITLESVHLVLGTSDENFLLEMITHLAKHEIVPVLESFNQVLSQGRDPAILLEQLCEAYRDLLYTLSGGNSEGFRYIAPTNYLIMREVAENTGLQAVMAAMQIIDHTLDRMRFTTQGRVLCELALTRIAKLNELDKLSKIISQLQRGIPTAAPGTGAGPASGQVSGPALLGGGLNNSFGGRSGDFNSGTAAPVRDVKAMAAGLAKWGQEMDRQQGAANRQNQQQAPTPQTGRPQPNYNSTPGGLGSQPAAGNNRSGGSIPGFAPNPAGSHIPGFSGTAIGTATAGINIAGTAATGTTAGSGTREWSQNQNQNSYSDQGQAPYPQYQGQGQGPGQGQGMGQGQGPYSPQGQYSGQSSYPQQGPFPQQGFYPQQGPYAQQGPYPQQTQYPTQGPYSQQTPYSQQGPYPQQGGYPPQGPYPTQGPYPAQGPYPPQGSYPPQGQYSPQGPYPAQGPYPTQGSYPEQGPYPAPSQNPYPPQGTHSQQAPYSGQSPNTPAGQNPGSSSPAAGSESGYSPSFFQNGPSPQTKATVHEEHTATVGFSGVTDPSQIPLGSGLISRFSSNPTPHTAQAPPHNAVQKNTLAPGALPAQPQSSAQEPFPGQRVKEADPRFSPNNYDGNMDYNGSNGNPVPNHSEFSASACPTPRPGNAIRKLGTLSIPELRDSLSDLFPDEGGLVAMGFRQIHSINIKNENILEIFYPMGYTMGGDDFWSRISNRRRFQNYLRSQFGEAAEFEIKQIEVTASPTENVPQQPHYDKNQKLNRRIINHPMVEFAIDNLDGEIRSVSKGSFNPPPAAPEVDSPSTESDIPGEPSPMDLYEEE